MRACWLGVMLKCRERLSARQARFMTLQFRFTTVVVRGFAHMARNGGLKGRRAPHVATLASRQLRRGFCDTLILSRPRPYESMCTHKMRCRSANWNSHCMTGDTWRHTATPLALTLQADHGVRA